MVLRLGIIGMSDGNGHPYSWSAICNGYNPTVMASCGFPAIPDYLKAQRFPEDFISDVAVTHIWTQDASRSRHIADAAYVETVVNHFTDMIGEVDGILLARDDAETHYEFAAPFLKADLPVYIDKPLALSRVEADAIFGCRQYSGQIFSCSALRYAKELALTPETQKSIGRIRYIQASVPKTWDKYAIHVIEPILNIVGTEAKFVGATARNFHGIESVVAEFENGLLINIVAFGKVPAPISIKIYGENRSIDLVFQDSFNAFKQALIEFSNSIIQKDIKISDFEMMRVVDFLESGRKCLRAERSF
jgi:predicted dehydrogenase